jgi:hypothetical protein
VFHDISRAVLSGTPILPTTKFNNERDTREYPKVSGLAVRSENSKWYSSLPLDAVVALFCESI